jgi:hypothetical protein
MARPPLPIGTYGSIGTERIGAGYRAFTRFRDHDGVTRKVERNGATPAAARAHREAKGKGDEGVSAG